MLETALKAGLPLVTCTTSDTVHLPEVLDHISGRPVAPLRLNPSVKTSLPSGTVLYAIGEQDITRKLLQEAIDTDSTILLVNSGKHPYALDAGEVPVPKVIVADYLRQVQSIEDMDAYLRLASGLTIKQTLEVVMLTEACYGTLTPKGFREFRAKVAGVQQGLQPVDTILEFYSENPVLSHWAQKNKKYFLGELDDRLVPRGVLLSGEPGTGKTMGAKYIAREWGVPLYRLDLSSSLGKYVGESEGNLSRILATVDREEPCVLLVDEVEKLFATTDDSGVTSRLLSQLLWWLQEHTSRVLTVMTTNAVDKLPSELHRAGRIDFEKPMHGLSKGESINFALRLLRQFTKTGGTHKEHALRSCVGAWFDHRPSSYKAPHAKIVGLVYDLIKTENWL